MMTIYERPIIEVVCLNNTDVITVSGDNVGVNEQEDIWSNSLK